MTDPSGRSDLAHRRLRERLGAFALGHLSDRDAVALRSHLDGCAACRAELADIAPLADDLSAVDPTRLQEQVSPPASLGRSIAAAVAGETQLRDARQRRSRRSRAARRVLAVATAAAVLGGSVAVTAAVTGGDTPTVATSTPPAVPVEPVAVSTGPGVTVSDAGLIAHTWGVEVRLVAAGLEAGGTYRAAFRSRDGRLLPAGEFLGTGQASLRCNLQAALLRTDTVGFVVLDDAGEAVLTAQL